MTVLCWTNQYKGHVTVTWLEILTWKWQCCSHGTLNSGISPCLIYSSAVFVGVGWEGLCTRSPWSSHGTFRQSSPDLDPYWLESGGHSDLSPWLQLCRDQIYQLFLNLHANKWKQLQRKSVAKKKKIKKMYCCQTYM